MLIVKVVANEPVHSSGHWSQLLAYKATVHIFSDITKINWYYSSSSHSWLFILSSSSSSHRYLDLVRNDQWQNWTQIPPPFLPLPPSIFSMSRSTFRSFSLAFCFNSFQCLLTFLSTVLYSISDSLIPSFSVYFLYLYLYMPTLSSSLLFLLLA